MRRFTARKFLVAALPCAIVLALVAILLLHFGVGGKGASVSGASTSFPVHFWISNQSLGTGIDTLTMEVEVDDVPIFAEPLYVGTQHTIAIVTEDLSPGLHTVTAAVPFYASEEVQPINVDRELWVFVRFWYDPVSVFDHQHTPTITIDVFDDAPGVA